MPDISETRNLPPGQDQDSSSTKAAEPQELDPLTGFHQQAYLDKMLAQNIQANKNSPVTASLALLQLENFYEIRTWLGKSDATLFLADIARLLKKSLPKSVVLCRCQHSEFAALLFDQASHNARGIAAEIRRVVESAASKALPGKLRLKIGIGIAEINDHSSNNDVMYARARHDMSVYKKRLSSTLSQAQSLSPDLVFKRLKKALNEGNLSLSFQAIISLKEDGIQHYELRTSAQDRQGVIPADLLFEVAVQNAWGDTIDRWLIRQAIRLLKQASQPGLKLTISITHNSIVNPEFFPWLANALKHTGELSSQLVFQISEIDILIAQHHMGYFCQQLNHYDIQLCINHFGCTDDPFRYLGLLRAELVKLDSSTLALSPSQEGTANLARLIERLHENGLRVIVAKVEKMTEMPALWACNVNYVQGFGFHKPGKTLDFEFMEEATLTLH